MNGGMERRKISRIKEAYCECLRKMRLSKETKNSEEAAAGPKMSP
jgi:hypothetical protein